MTKMPQNALTCYLAADLNYSCTNESLPSIIAGMEPDEKDIILAICGSGDQAFALLGSGAKVIAVDKDSRQVEFARARLERLRRGDYDGFLSAPPAFNPCDPIARDIYFGRGNTLENIRARLANVSFRRQDITQLDYIVDKAYLSNVLDWITDDKSVTDFLQRLASHIRQEGLVYLADKGAVKEHKILWNKEFEIDKRLTERAVSLTYYGDTHWIPIVLRKK